MLVKIPGDRHKRTIRMENIKELRGPFSDRDDGEWFVRVILDDGSEMEALFGYDGESASNEWLNSLLNQ